MQFLNVFLFCWFIFALPDPILNSDPDPLTCLNSDTIRIRNTGGDKLTIMYPYLMHTGTLPCMFLFAEIRIMIFKLFLFLFVGCTKEPVQLRDAHPATLGHVRHSHSRTLREPLQNRRTRGIEPTKIKYFCGGQGIL